MPCPPVENLFIEHAGLIRNDVAKSIMQTDFYLRELPREQWLDGNGYQYSYPVYERSLPSSPVAFVPFATVNETPNGNNNLPDTGACAIPGETIESFGITLRQTVLKKAALNSPDICLDDLRFNWQVMDQVKNITRVLSENGKWVWQNAYQDEYSDAAGNKMIAEPDLATDDAEFPEVAPTSKLTWGLLEHVYEQLGYAGGGINPYQRVDDMTPIYAAVGDRFTFADLKRLDQNTRDDFHWSSKSDEMLGAPGLHGVYRGFKFFTVEFPPRLDLVGGEWVRREVYSSEEATRGKKWEVSDEYKNAAYTDTAIFHKDVMKVLIPKPQGKIGDLTYNPQYSWAGEFAWRNIASRDCNVDGNTGFFRALYAYGVKVNRPDLGFVIRHKRCERALDLLGCS